MNEDKDRPVVSMTGQGAASASVKGVHVEVTLASVNRKQLELLVAVPRELAALEPEVQGLLRSRLVRGRVMGEIRVSAPPAAAGASDGPLPDPSVAARLIAALRKIAAENGLEDDLSASDLLAIPDFIPSAAPPPPPSELVRPALLAAVTEALDRLVAFRRREGAVLAVDLLRRLDALGVLRETIAARGPAVAADYQARLTRRITDALAAAGLPVSAETLERVVRETALYADHADIAEELTRLDSHLAQARALLAPAPETPPADIPHGPPPAHGRTLDFLAQEMGREINTIGSKANDADIAHAVIAFKTELERFREQVQNIE
ncbi:MAG: YicC family protein [Kiritimatiellae bacterium]|nr:YicC family protein [Kiritimatiellia bacterium]